MPRMPTDLSPQSEAVIQQMLAAGTFPDRAALLDTAVGLLAAQREELRRLIQEGADSGPSLPGPVVLERIRKRAAEIATTAEAVG